MQESAMVGLYIEMDEKGVWCISVVAGINTLLFLFPFALSLSHLSVVGQGKADVSGSISAINY